MKIRIKDKRIVPLIKEKLYKTKQFENLLLILINQDNKQNDRKHFKYLTDSSIMRAIITGNDGDKNRQEEIEFIKDYYKNNQLMKELIEVGKQLKIHNIVEQIKDIKKNYKSFFKKLKNGDKKAKPPKPKKLKKINNMTLFMDGYKSYSFSKKNKIGININKKMKYTYAKHEAILKVVGNFDNIKNVNINYSNGYIYLLINYEKPEESLENKGLKIAGLDIGVNNLVSLYIDDDKDNSLIIDGTQYKTYNSEFNRQMSKLNVETDFWNDYIGDKDKTNLNEGLEVSLDLDYLKKFKNFLYEKRNNYFYSEFHKLSKRILEYLYLQGVSTLVVSSSLAVLKNNGECKLRKDTKQNFIQIPFMKLIHNLKEKSSKYGIVVQDVDESYTSKTSCINGNIHDVKEKAKKGEKLSTDDFKGSRVKRGLFKDHILNKVINADLNGACNIIKVFSVTLTEREIYYRKFCNPKKVKSDHQFLNLVLSNRCVG